jgi:heme exporter protein A
MWRIVGDQISHTFNKRTIFSNISFEVESGRSIVLIGPNGSGKTTLVKIICQLLKPSGGKLSIYQNGKITDHSVLYSAVGLVGPYLQLYNNLTALENYAFFSRIRGLTVNINYFKELMNQFGLKGREMDELRTYSSGMLQRAKYVMALIHQPEILILDEPTSNLDEEGVRIVYELIKKQMKDKILILATNEPEEFKFGDKQICLSA